MSKEPAGTKAPTLKDKCLADMTSLLRCKKENPQDYKTKCTQHAVKLANCAALNFCPDQHSALREAKGDKTACQEKKRELDHCFKDKGFPIPPSK